MVRHIFALLAMVLLAPPASAQVNFQFNLGPPAYTRHPNYLGDWRRQIVFYKDGTRWCGDVVRIFLEAAPDVRDVDVSDSNKNELVAAAFRAGKTACPQSRVAVGRLQMTQGAFVYIRSAPDNFADWQEVSRTQAMAGYVDPALAAQRAEDARLRAARAAEQRAAATPPLPAADTSPWASSGVRVRTLTARLQNLDDIGAAVLITPDGRTEMLAVGEWNGATGAGSGNAVLSDKLKPGPNTVVFFIFNKAFSMWTGKWTYDFALLGDNQTLWSSSGGLRETAIGIRYWRAFIVERVAGGAIGVRSQTPNEVAALTPVMDRLNTQMVRNAPSADNAAMLGVASLIGQALVYSTFNSGSSSPSSGGSNENCRLECVMRNRDGCTETEWQCR